MSRPAYEELVAMLRKLAWHIDIECEHHCVECDAFDFSPHEPDCDLGQLLARLDEPESRPCDACDGHGGRVIAGDFYKCGHCRSGRLYPGDG